MAFDASGAGLTTTVFYVRSVHQEPYNVSVLEVSALILFPVAEAPAPASTGSNVSEILSKHGCRRFARLVTETGDAAAIFEESIQDGVTIFCPEDRAVEAFEPVFSRAAAEVRLAVVLYHGVVGHYPVKALEANQNDLLTLASLKPGAFYGCAKRLIDGSIILVSASDNVARVTRLLVDVNGIAVYSIDKVLLPFNVSAPPENLTDDQQKGASLCSPFALLLLLIFLAYEA